MKRILILISFMLLTLTGCGTYTKEDAIKDFTESISSSKSYEINGTMEISNGEEIFTYSIQVYYLKDDYYKVILINQTNNHEQVILKNDDGLYVITPSLNKSFKFDSVWPENSSQAYLLGNLVNDLEADANAEFDSTDDEYILTTKVNYPNNEELTNQKIYFDKDMNIKLVEVYNDDDTVQIKVTFKNVNLNAKLSEDDFLLEDLIDTDENDTLEDECTTDECNEKTTSTIDTIIYPLYIPSNTYLSSSDTIDTDDGERVILTFSGDSNFVIVEQTLSASSEFEVIPVFGDPLMLDNTIAALSTNSISWNSSNLSYYLVSSDLSTSELVSIAKSLGASTTVLSTK